LLALYTDYTDGDFSCWCLTNVRSKWLNIINFAT